MNNTLPQSFNDSIPTGLLEENGDETYVLSLFISGITPRSTRAVANIKRICEERLHGRYNLEIVDIYQQPELASAHQVIAVPTLIKRFPSPMRRLIGDMSNEAKVLVGLDLPART